MGRRGGFAAGCGTTGGRRCAVGLPPFREWPGAAAGPFGATIAHGNLTLSLIPGLLDDALSLQMPTGPRINYGYNRVRFVSPVKVNSELRAGARLVSAEPVAQGWQLVVEVTVEARNAPKPACVAELVYRWYPS